MQASLSQREYINWRKYWDEEPWGPYRDNLHTAVLAREIRRPQLRPGSRIDMNDFMLRSTKARNEERASGVLRFLRMISVPANKEGSDGSGKASS